MDKELFDLVMGPGVLDIDTTKGDVVITIPESISDDCIIYHEGRIVGFDWSQPDDIITVGTERKAIEIHVENIELKKQLEELRRELEDLESK